MSNKNYLLKYMKYIGLSAAILLAVSCKKDEVELDNVDGLIENMEGTNKKVLDTQDEIDVITVNLKSVLKSATDQELDDETRLKYDNLIKGFDSKVAEYSIEMEKFKSDRSRDEVEPTLTDLKVNISNLKESYDEAKELYDKTQSLEGFVELNEEYIKSIKNFTSENDSIIGVYVDMEANLALMSKEEFSTDSTSLRLGINNLDSSIEDAIELIQSQIATAEALNAEAESEEFDLVIANLKVREEELVALQQEASENSDELDRLSSEHDFITVGNEIEAEIEALNEAHEVALEELDNIKLDEMTSQEVAELTSKYQTMVIENQAKIDALVGILDIYKAKFPEDESKMTKIVELTAAVESTQDDLTSIDTKNKKIQDEFSDNIEYLVTNYSSNVTTFDTSVDGLSTNESSLYSQIESVNSTIASANNLSDLDGVDTEITNIKNLISALATSKATVTGTATSLTTDYSSISGMIADNDPNKGALDDAKDKFDEANNELSGISTSDLENQANALLTAKTTKENEIKAANEAEQNAQTKAEVESEISTTEGLINSVSSEINSISSDITTLENSVNAGTAVAQSEINTVNSDIDALNFSTIEAKISQINSKIATITDANIRAELEAESAQLSSDISALKALVEGNGGLESRIDEVESKNDDLANNQTFSLDDLKSADFSGTTVTIDGTNNICSISGGEFNIFMDNLKNVTFDNPNSEQVSFEINGATLTISDLSYIESRDIKINKINGNTTLSNSGTLTLTQHKNLFDLDINNGGYRDQYGDWIDGPKLPINEGNNNFKNLSIDLEGSNLDMNDKYLLNILHYLGETASPKNGTLTGGITYNDNPTSTWDAGTEDRYTSLDDPSLTLDVNVKGSLREQVDAINGVNAWSKLSQIECITLTGHQEISTVLDGNGDLIYGADLVLKNIQDSGKDVCPDGASLSSGKTVTSEALNDIQDRGVKIGMGEGCVVIGEETLTFDDFVTAWHVIYTVPVEFNGTGLTSSVDFSIFYKGVSGNAGTAAEGCYVGVPSTLDDAVIHNISDHSSRVIDNNGENIRVLDDDVLFKLYRDPSTGFIPANAEDWGKLTTAEYDPNVTAYNTNEGKPLPKEFNNENLDEMLEWLGKDLDYAMNNSESNYKIDQAFETQRNKKVVTLSRENQREIS